MRYGEIVPSLPATLRRHVAGCLWRLSSAGTLPSSKVPLVRVLPEGGARLRWRPFGTGECSALALFGEARP